MNEPLPQWIADALQRELISRSSRMLEDTGVMLEEDLVEAIYGRLLGGDTDSESWRQAGR